jgi:hypothetical protein
MGTLLDKWAQYLAPNAFSGFFRYFLNLRFVILMFGEKSPAAQSSVAMISVRP